MIPVTASPYQLLLDQLEAFNSVAKDDLDLIRSCFQVVQAKKGEILIHQGNLVHHLYFINSGYVRTFFLNENGEEFTTSLGEKGQMISSYEGFQRGVKSTESVQAMTDSTLLMVNKTDYDRVYREVNSWPRFCSGFTEEAILRSGERLLDLQRLSASERYEKLLKNRPNIAMNVPVKFLASYLGIQPQSLSRIRAQRK
ncbi:Crp/Fnr family transcriptional regulator [Marinoscillum pacificum]|uniref:Crp/Fnr family transcriptional regulator n=1 Tax=Marinoscillum pacificum TaxID=392723 RepID=UPI00215890E2|nr:Crp/Fnr family transcriptional regulator [Marinoscillum pacificum]